jgi:hypothetical protein
VLYDLATALQAVTGAARPIKLANREAANRARDYIDARLDEGVSLEALERATDTTAGSCLATFARCWHQPLPLPDRAPARQGPPDGARRLGQRGGRPRVRVRRSESLRARASEALRVARNPGRVRRLGRTAYVDNHCVHREQLGARLASARAPWTECSFPRSPPGVHRQAISARRSERDVRCGSGWSPRCTGYSGWRSRNARTTRFASSAWSQK